MKAALDMHQPPLIGAEPVDRYTIRVIPLDVLGETRVVDEVWLTQARRSLRITLHWRRIFEPTGEGRITLGTFEGLDVDAFGALKRRLSELAAERREEWDVAREVSRAVAEAERDRGRDAA